VADPALHSLDDATRLLVRAATAIAGLDDDAVLGALSAARRASVPVEWVEELLLQSHLFCGFPRALNATRQWRGLVPGVPVEPPEDPAHWRARGEATCRAVYGPMYERLRESVAGLHPRLDDWMVADGYGKVLGRPALDLARRELCIVVACAVSGQERQLHSHLRGALNVGASADVVRGSLEAVRDLLGPERTTSALRLLDRVAAR
jgi:4-carboxymuconolactone decarboxylase